MPLFEWKCEACDKVYELLHSCCDVPVCPDCAGPMRKLLSGFAYSSKNSSRESSSFKSSSSSSSCSGCSGGSCSTCH